MNDRFKFRVWDIEDCTYFEPGDFDDLWLNKNAELRVGFYSDATQMIEDYTDNVIIEQCTGLKDKNGNLIYEGDIIKNKIIEYIVKWEGCCWVVESKSNVNIGGFLDDFLHCEIIGNIHEQPEQKDAK